MPFWKPEPWAKVKARRQAEDRERRRVCLDAVWTRHGGRCGRCGRPVKRADDPSVRHEFEIGHGHEIVPRSLGGSPYDPLNVELLCAADHDRAHGRKVAG